MFSVEVYICLWPFHFPYHQPFQMLSLHFIQSDFICGWFCIHNTTKYILHLHMYILFREYCVKLSHETELGTQYICRFHHMILTTRLLLQCIIITVYICISIFFSSRHWYNNAIIAWDNIQLYHFFDLCNFHSNECLRQTLSVTYTSHSKRANEEPCQTDILSVGFA